MKSQKGQNPSTVLKNNSKKTFSKILKFFDLKISEKISLFDLIMKIHNKGFTIYEILGRNFNIDIEVIKEARQSKFRERFFTNLLCDSKDAAEDFIFIMKIIDEKFVVRKIEIREDHIYIRGNAVDISLFDMNMMPFDTSYPLLLIR